MEHDAWRTVKVLQMPTRYCHAGNLKEKITVLGGLEQCFLFCFLFVLVFLFFKPETNFRLLFRKESEVRV